MKRTIILVLIISVAMIAEISVQSQPNYLNGPEGIAFYPPEKAWYVTNAEDGKIIKIDSLGNQSVFWEGINIPIGIEAIGDSLYISSNEPFRVTCLSIPDCTEVYHLELVNIFAVSHMDYDPRSGLLYLVNQYGGLIKIHVYNRIYSIFVPVGGGIPGGSQTVIADTLVDRLYIFSWPQTPVRSVNMTDSTDVDFLFWPGTYEFISSTTDCYGYMYVSSWRTDKVYRYPPQFNGNPVVFSTGHSNPAGMAFNPFDEVIAVCNWGDNTVDFISVYTGIDEPRPDTDQPAKLNCFPNPVTSCVNISFQASGNDRSVVIILDARGNIAMTQQMMHHTNGEIIRSIPTETLAAGTYQVCLLQGGNLSGQKIIEKIRE